MRLERRARLLDAAAVALVAASASALAQDSLWAALGLAALACVAVVLGAAVRAEGPAVVLVGGGNDFPNA